MMRRMSRSILITGGSAGIGAALAFEFARRGYKVAIAARRADKLAELVPQLQAAGAAAAVAIVLDVGDTDSIAGAVTRAAQALGRLDIVVANAGIAHATPAGKGRLPQIRETININLVGAIATIEAALPVLLQQGGGQIVGVTSVAGARACRGSAPTARAKAGLSRYLQSLRAELRGGPIVVTELAPGYIDTDLNRGAASRPFVIPVERGAAIMARMIERKVGMRWVPVLPWSLIAPLLLKMLPLALLAPQAKRRPTGDDDGLHVFRPRSRNCRHDRVKAFMDEHEVYPAEARFHDEVEANRALGNAWVPTAGHGRTEGKGRAAGLWNLWLPDSGARCGASPTWNTRRSPRSPAARTSRPRRSTARRLTPVTWKCWCVTAMPNRKSVGSSRCWPARSAQASR
jgi:NAD(P)-dependent dehydrogenase (short-subunit alcohol dehydrogenase family)